VLATVIAACCRTTPSSSRTSTQLGARSVVAGSCGCKVPGGVGGGCPPRLHVDSRHALLSSRQSCRQRPPRFCAATRSRPVAPARAARYVPCVPPTERGHMA